MLAFVGVAFGYMGMGDWGGAAKNKHEWSYEEFLSHKEENKGPGHANIMSGWGNWNALGDDLSKRAEGDTAPRWPPQRIEPETTDEHHEFRAKSVEQKKEHYEEWVAEHTEAHEREQYERTFRYQSYYFFFHFKSGFFGVLLLVVKFSLIISCCWCLQRQNTRNRLARDLCSGFSRGTVRRKKD